MLVRSGCLVKGPEQLRVGTTILMLVCRFVWAECRRSEGKRNASVMIKFNYKNPRPLPHQEA